MKNGRLQKLQMSIASSSSRDSAPPIAGRRGRGFVARDGESPPVTSSSSGYVCCSCVTSRFDQAHCSDSSSVWPSLAIFFIRMHNFWEDRHSVFTSLFLIDFTYLVLFSIALGQHYITSGQNYSMLTSAPVNICILPSLSRLRKWPKLAAISLAEFSIPDGYNRLWQSDYNLLAFGSKNKFLVMGLRLWRVWSRLQGVRRT